MRIYIYIGQIYRNAAAHVRMWILFTDSSGEKKRLAIENGGRVNDAHKDDFDIESALDSNKAQWKRIPMKKLAGYILINKPKDILLVLNEACDVMWIPTRSGMSISVERRKRADIESWINNPLSLVTPVHSPHE